MNLGQAGVRMKEVGIPDLTSCILGHPQVFTRSVAALGSVMPSRNSLCTRLLPKPLRTQAPPWRRGPKRTQSSPMAERSEGAQPQNGTEGEAQSEVDVPVALPLAGGLERGQWPSGQPRGPLGLTLALGEQGDCPRSPSGSVCQSGDYSISSGSTPCPPSPSPPHQGDFF